MDKKITFTMQTSKLNVNITKRPCVSYTVEKVINNQLKDHSKLNNLDYEHSGHTGFASEERVNLLEQLKVPKRLSTLSNVNNTDDRSKMYLYVDNDGKDNKISLKQALSTLIRTSDEIPTDLQVGEYVFLKLDKEK